MSLFHTYISCSHTPSVRERRLAFFEGADVPLGFEDAAKAAEKKAEDLKPAVDALKAGARSVESTLRTDAEMVRESASAMARLESARLDFQRYAKKYLTNEQFALVHERNILLAKKEEDKDGSAMGATPEGSIILGVTEGKLRVLSGSTTELESLLSPVRALERKHDPKKPTSFYKRDLDKAITDFFRNTAPTTDKLLKSLTPRGTTYATFDLIKREHAEWVKNYPREYLRVLTQGIRLNPALIARLERGREDSAFVSDTELESLVKKLVIEEGKYDVLQHLSPVWKKQNEHFFRTSAMDAAGRDPAALRAVRYQDFQEDYEPDYADRGARKVRYEDVVRAALEEDGKTKEAQERSSLSIYDVDRQWIEEEKKEPGLPNREKYHLLFKDVATRQGSTVLRNLIGTDSMAKGKLIDRRDRLNGYFIEGRERGQEGWAYAILDVTRSRPEMFKQVSAGILADLKSKTPDVYDKIKAEAMKQADLTLALKDPDAIRRMFESKSTELLAALQKDPTLLKSIPFEILKDPRNREAAKQLIATHPVLLQEVPQWQRDRSVVGELIMKNATVYAHISPSFQNEAKLILAALVAEQEGRGNFHWEWVPAQAYKDIVKLAWGGDPSAETFLTALLDPEKLKDPQKRFTFIDAMPLSALTRENLLKLSAHFYAAPEMFGRLIERMSTDPRAAALLRDGLKDIDGFLFPLLTGTRPSGESAIAVPELMRYLTPEATGLGWKEIVKLAEDTRTMNRIDFKKLDLADLKKICIVLKPIDRTTMWGRLSERTLADFLIQDLVPYSGVSLNAIPVEMISEIGKAKISQLQKKRLISGDVAKKLLDRK